MRAQLRTYHPIPALQAHQDPNAYKQLQDAPRLKSILKGATEDEPQPSTIEELVAASVPRTNPVNLIFVMSQYAPKISEVHFQPPRDFFDLMMRPTLSSASRAKAFLWLLWWYLESDFSETDAQRNPFGPGHYGDEGEGGDGLPLKVPTLESLTEEQAAAENVDTEEEQRYGEAKGEERKAILASEPSPAMTALKRARKEKGLIVGGPASIARSDDEASEVGFARENGTSFGKTVSFARRAPGDYTRSPSLEPGRGFQAVNTRPTGDMRINSMLNTDGDEGDFDHSLGSNHSMEGEAPRVSNTSHQSAGYSEDPDTITISNRSPPRTTAPASATSTKKGPGRGNWRRNKTKHESLPLAARPSDHHIPLLPNTPLSFVNDTPQQMQQQAAATASSSQPDNQPKRPLHRPTTTATTPGTTTTLTHHSALLTTHRRQQINHTLSLRLRHVHARARVIREHQGPLLRAWKRLKLMPSDYDSDEEAVRFRRAREKVQRDEEWRSAGFPTALLKAKENFAGEEGAAVGVPRVPMMAGFARVVGEGDENGAQRDLGEEAKVMAGFLGKVLRRLRRWEEYAPGEGMVNLRLYEEGKRRSAVEEDDGANGDEGEGDHEGASLQRRGKRKRSGGLTRDEHKEDELGGVKRRRTTSSAKQPDRDPQLDGHDHGNGRKKRRRPRRTQFDDDNVGPQNDPSHYAPDSHALNVEFQSRKPKRETNPAVSYPPPPTHADSARLPTQLPPSLDEPDEQDGGGDVGEEAELDAEDRELLGEVDADGDRGGDGSEDDGDGDGDDGDEGEETEDGDLSDG